MAPFLVRHACQCGRLSDDKHPCSCTPRQIDAYRFQEGKVIVNHNRFLGYTKDESGELVIVPEEAEIIKRIYREFMEGKSPYKIATNLQRAGIITGSGGLRWYDSTVNKISKNEKYMGDALLQKTYTVDFLTRKRIKNNGHAAQYYVEDSHPAIIIKEEFASCRLNLKDGLICVAIPKRAKANSLCNSCWRNRFDA